jgi:hypothetical protein
MGNFIAQPAVATASDLSFLLTGLVGIMWVSVGMLAWMAIRHYIAQPTLPVAGITLAPIDAREAA